MTAALLALERVSVAYGKRRELDDVAMEVMQGEIVTLLGANGAGKSTTLNSISGIVRPRTGQILFDGHDLAHVPPHDIVPLGVIQVPEGRRTFARLTVEENLAMGGFSLKSRAEVREGIERAFALFPRLRERRAQIAGTLSGGEQQMLAMGRSLMAQPRVLLLDEPSMGLAPTLVELIFENIERIHREGTAILLVEQNAHMALKVAQHFYLIEQGQVTFSGDPGSLAEDEVIRRAYLGSSRA